MLDEVTIFGRKKWFTLIIKFIILSVPLNNFEHLFIRYNCKVTWNLCSATFAWKCLFQFRLFAIFFGLQFFLICKKLTSFLECFLINECQSYRLFFTSLRFVYHDTKFHQYVVRWIGKLKPNIFISRFITVSQKGEPMQLPRYSILHFLGSITYADLMYVPLLPVLHFPSSWLCSNFVTQTKISNFLHMDQGMQEDSIFSNCRVDC